jgi:hypothetical protein
MFLIGCLKFHISMPAMPIAQVIAFLPFEMWWVCNEKKTYHSSAFQYDIGAWSVVEILIIISISVLL